MTEAQDAWHVDDAAQAGPGVALDAGILSMLELRVLSGLSRGAALPIELAPVTIGPQPSCDLVLVDAGLEGVATLRCDAQGLCEFEIPPAPGGDAAPPRRIAEGEMFDWASVRLQVSRTDRSWDFELPVPPPSGIAASDTAAPAASAAPASVRPAPAGVRAAPRSVRILLPVVLAVLILALGITWWSRRGATPAAAPPVSKAPPPAPTPEQLVFWAERLRALLRDAGVDGALVTSGAGELVVDGQIEPERQEAFERVITRFRREHRPVRVLLRMASRTVVPDFVVRVIVGGEIRTVVLDDERQLTIGMVEQGWRLSDIAGVCAVFVNERDAQKSRVCLDRLQK